MAKFTPLEDFKHGSTTFEEGNSYDSEKHGLDEDDLKVFHGAGWAEVEGWDAPPPREPGAVTLEVAKARHTKAVGGPLLDAKHE